MRPRVKICCISSIAEAELAISQGASAIGLVAHMPSGPGIIDESLIAAIAARTPPGVASFLLTSLQSVEAIVAQHRRCGTNTIQICDRLEFGYYQDLRQALPGIAIVQVIHVTDETSIQEAKNIAQQGVHALLLDSGNPTKAVKELGGTGRTHNWSLSKQIVEQVDVPVFLAGGLKAENVAEAWAKVAPFGLDLCSGVRTDDHLDPEKLRAFFQQLPPT